jgi:hypothetical protein
MLKHHPPVVTAAARAVLHVRQGKEAPETFNVGLNVDVSVVFAQPASSEPQVK